MVRIHHRDRPFGARLKPRLFLQDRGKLFTTLCQFGFVLFQMLVGATDRSGQKHHFHTGIALLDRVIRA